MRPLTLDIVGSHGRVFHETNLQCVVVRRREEISPGSEVAILPGHAPLLMQTEPCIVRYSGPAGPGSIAVGAGLLEVWEGGVSLALT